MKNNYVNEAGTCCPVQVEKCIPERLSVCGEAAREAYEKYLHDEACKKEEKQFTGLCDDDPNEVYFMQYRSKRAFYDEPWLKTMYKDIYNINAHK
jgi:hypothetical protein